MYVDDFKLVVKKQNIDPTWKILMEDVDLGEPTPFLDHVYLGCSQRECQLSKNIVDNYRMMFESKISAGAIDKYQFPRHRMQIFPHGPVTGKVMQRSTWQDYELTNKTTHQLYKVSTSCMNDHQFKEGQMRSVGELSKSLDICHLKNAELEARHRKYEGRIVLRGDIEKDDSGSYAVFTEQGSSASQMTAAKVLDIISRLSGCAGQAADAISA